MVTKPINFATEKILSVEDELIKYQAGTVVSGVNASSTFIPCAINKVLGVTITPVKLGSTSANLTAFNNMYEVEDILNLSSVSDLPAWTANTSYLVDQIVSFGGKAYQCVVDHTSSTSFNSANWKELKETTFLKVNHSAAGAGKVVSFSFLVVGY